MASACALSSLYASVDRRVDSVIARGGKQILCWNYGTKTHSKHRTGYGDLTPIARFIFGWLAGLNCFEGFAGGGDGFCYFGLAVSCA
jgi:hypothetical protein